ncbi:AraC family transcriptional regulator [Tropicibacter sp. R15_0]|uniref:AraC family transcriptional regulator n=1 Tax=Tropicibacter sp. R15_0 TaxID=2821101 RepID=UPI001ADC044B|nr:AraC family transcriptional regulator [Tropicibacter sp. R15_0]MBO9466239.1 AraC family transcriptional regulator [Tropicibacter sp. R15_0]
MSGPNRPDRLADLIERFDIAITPVVDEPAHLVVTQSGAGQHILFHKQAQPASGAKFAALVDWGSKDNPIQRGLPERMEMPVTSPDLQGLVIALTCEAEAHRCGGTSVMRRLAEVIIVRLLRFQFENGCAQIGILSGLSDDRLARALVAMHNRPGHGWTGPDLAAEAGLSPSRFAEIFAQKVGQTPMSYLRQWRLSVARQDLRLGHRVDAVSRRYGYASPEAFSRAFRQKYGVPPLAIRGREGTAPGAKPTLGRLERQLG